MSKGFDQSAVAGAITPATACGHPAQGRIWLEVNGESRQQGDLADMMWKVPEIIANLSTLVRLEAGDLIYTGTPAGVGPVHRGDVLVAGWTALPACGPVSSERTPRRRAGYSAGFGLTSAVCR
jgi:fumarylpyruvate hydrolase